MTKLHKVKVAETVLNRVIGEEAVTIGKVVVK